MITNHDPVGLLYHGTRRAAAGAILKQGFRRSRCASYTGSGICLSERLSVAYEFGAYEAGGCVLEVTLLPAARWKDSNDLGAMARLPSPEAWDRYFVATGEDAVRAYFGNVWVLWTPDAVATVRRLPHAEAIRRLCNEFDEDGPDHGYNGVASDYASLWWGQADQDPNLRRSPEHKGRLERTLRRAVRRTTSASLNR